MGFRMRMLHPDIWASGTVDKLTDHQFRIYISLISHADDDGYFELDPALLRSFTFPRRAHPPRLKAFEDALNALIQAKDHRGDGLICAYIYNNQPYGHHPKWGKYQKPSHATKSKLPPCPKCHKGQGVMINSVRDTGGLPEGSPKPPSQVRLGRVRLGKVKKTLASPKKETPAPPKKSVPKKTNPDVKKFIDHAFNTYKEKTGDKLPIAGGKHGDKIKRLLEQKPEPFTLQELMAYWDYFLVMPPIIEDKQEVRVSLDTFVGYLPTIISRYRPQRIELEKPQKPALFPAGTKARALTDGYDQIAKGEVGIARGNHFVFPRKYLSMDFFFQGEKLKDWEILCKTAQK